MKHNFTAPSQIIVSCKKKGSCPACGANNGVVKKGALLKILHDYARSPGKSKRHDTISKHNTLFRDAIAYNKEVAPLVNKAVEVITPLKTLELFNNIRPDEVSSEYRGVV